MADKAKKDPKPPSAAAGALGATKAAKTTASPSKKASKVKSGDAAGAKSKLDAKKKKRWYIKGYPAVPESVLKRCKKRDLAKKSAIQKALKKKAVERRKRKIIFKRAEKYVKEYRQKERDEIRFKRQARNKGNYYIPNFLEVEKMYYYLMQIPNNITNINNRLDILKFTSPSI